MSDWLWARRAALGIVTIMTFTHVVYPLLSSGTNPGVDFVGGSAYYFLGSPQTRAMQLVNPHNTRPDTVEYFFTAAPSDEERLWSGVQCVGPSRNRSCVMDNLYYLKNGEKFLLILPEDPAKLGNILSTVYPGRALTGPRDVGVVTDSGIAVAKISIHDMMKECTLYSKGSPLRPDVMFFNDSDAARDYLITLSHAPVVFEGISAAGRAPWSQNIGHALYDGLYPLFVSMIRFGYAADDINLFMQTDKGLARQESDQVFTVFAGGRYSRVDELLYPVTRFDRMVMGSHRMGHRTPIHDNSMPGSYTYENALWLFTQRFLSRYGIRDPATAMSPDTPVVSDFGAHCKGVIVDNKRFDADERKLLLDLAENSKELFGCDIKFMYWKRNSFEQQLRIFAESDVYISSVGTGITRAHFTKPGGVVVQLCEFVKTGDPPRFQWSVRDVQFAVGAPYLHSVYYPAKLWQLFAKLQKEPTHVVIEQAVDIVKKGYPIPRPFRDAVAPSGETVLKYCDASPADCQEMLGYMNYGEIPGGHYKCEHCGWFDYVNLSPLWTRGGCVYEKSNERVHCKLNFDLFEKFSTSERQAFNATCYETTYRSTIPAVKAGLLEDAAKALGTDVDKLSPAQATQAMLKGKVPDHCPFIVPEDAPCAC